LFESVIFTVIVINTSIYC